MAASVTAPTVPPHSLAAPQIHATAQIHPFTRIVGDVRLGEHVVVAPGTSIRADAGMSSNVGSGSQLQDGVIVHGRGAGRVLGDDDQEYAVWIGHRTSINHMALVHGPAYVGNDCFVGLRSTIFNARVGHGCIVMMHCLIQDVEIPTGRLVPSGAVITTQSQADALPAVTERDRQFTQYVSGMSERSVVPTQSPPACTLPNQNDMATTYSSANSMATEVANHVRQLLAQGYRIGTEHASSRQFKGGAWQTCATIPGTQDSAVLSALQSCLADHSGEYVRLIGIDPKAKKRVLEKIIQRPTDAPIQLSGQGGSYNAPAASYVNSATHAASSGDGAIAGQVRQVFSRGGRISFEYASARQFKGGAWQTGGFLNSSNESGAIAELNQILAAHAGEFVRIVGVDTKAKQRILEAIVQRPDGKVVVQSQSNGSSPSYSAPSQGFAAPTAGGGDLAGLIQGLLNQGATIGLEYASPRHFRACSWSSAPLLSARSSGDAISSLNRFLSEHPGDYVRLIGVDNRAKRRVLEQIIQRPGQAAPTAPTASYSSNHNAAPSASHNSAPAGGSSLNADAANHIRSLVRNGHKITLEFADKRRYKINSWQTAGVIQTGNESSAIAQAESLMAEYAGAYIQLVGTDMKSKRRVVEAVIHKP